MSTLVPEVAEVAAARNYEFAQALLQHVLAVRASCWGRRAQTGRPRPGKNACPQRLGLRDLSCAACCAPCLCSLHLPTCPPCCWIPQVHGDAVVRSARLADAAERLQRGLQSSWRRLDGLLQAARCIVDFCANTQA